MATYTVSADLAEEKTFDGTPDDFEVALNRYARHFESLDSTYWVVINIKDSDGDIIESERVAVHPQIPKCKDGREHVWRDMYSVVGGIEENPGVWAHGGGIISRDHCVICGCGRTTDTWAQCSETGVQGLTSVSYKVKQYPFGINIIPEYKWCEVGADPTVQYAEAWGLHWLRGGNNDGPYDSEDEALSTVKVAA